MVDISDDAKDGGYRRIEVLTRPGRRREWSDDDKALIVAETLRPGSVVADVARRWQVRSRQGFTWWREMRHAAVSPLDFVPIVAELTPSVPKAAVSPAGPLSSVGLQLADATLRVAPGIDGKLLTTVLRAIRASAA